MKIDAAVWIVGAIALAVVASRRSAAAPAFAANDGARVWVNIPDARPQIGIPDSNDTAPGGSDYYRGIVRNFSGDSLTPTPISTRAGEFISGLILGPFAPIVKRAPGGTDYNRPLMTADQAALQSWNFAIAAGALAAQGNTLGRGSAI